MNMTDKDKQHCTDIAAIEGYTEIGPRPVGCGHIHQHPWPGKASQA